MMPEHCLFCDGEVVYTNGYLSNRVPGLEVKFGLCEKHAYVKYRTKSGQPLKKPQFNFAFTKKAWAWAKERISQEEAKDLEHSQLRVN